jgi:hypothetical protein
MLCTFHAIWLPFKRDIYHLLPARKSKDGKLIELTEAGRDWGEFLFVITPLKFPVSDSFLSFSKIHLWCLSITDMCLQIQGTI